MDFSTFIIIVIVLAMVSAIGSVLWWVLLIYLGLQAWRRIAKQLDVQAVDMQRLIRQAGSVSVPQRKKLEGALSIQMMNFQQRMRELDNVHRQRYELKASEIQSMAASHGLSVDIPSWN